MLAPISAGCKAPSPFQGEGWGEGGFRYMVLHCFAMHPSSQPSPLLGEKGSE